jgi:hypothetical protein
MTQPKKKPSYSSTNLRTPICTKMVACDGANLVGKNRIEKGYCGKCEEALEKRKKAAPPLKGENSALQGKLRELLPDNWNRYNEDDD